MYDNKIDPEDCIVGKRASEAAMRVSTRGSLMEIFEESEHNHSRMAENLQRLSDLVRRFTGDIGEMPNRKDLKEPGNVLEVARMQTAMQEMECLILEDLISRLEEAI